METAPAATPGGAAVRGKAPVEVSEKEPAGEMIQIAAKAETAAAAKTETLNNRKEASICRDLTKPVPGARDP